MTGALIGGTLGMERVIFLIPRMDSLTAYLLILAAWVSLGSERISYAGWQIGLAFYMSILQDPHPTTKLDIIRAGHCQQNDSAWSLRPVSTRSLRDFKEG